jgi:hypothetical protein
MMQAFLLDPSQSSQPFWPLMHMPGCGGDTPHVAHCEMPSAQKPLEAQSEDDLHEVLQVSVSGLQPNSVGHIVGADGEHWPAPLHLPPSTVPSPQLAPQVAPGVDLQVPVPEAAQLEHSPAQWATLQHTPSVQWPVPHSSPVVQSTPGSFTAVQVPSAESPPVPPPLFAQNPLWQSLLS